MAFLCPLQKSPHRRAQHRGEANQWAGGKKSSTEELPQTPCPQHVPAAHCSKPAPGCLLGAIQRLLCSPPLLRAEQDQQPQSWAGNANLPDVPLHPPCSTTINPKSCTKWLESNWAKAVIVGERLLVSPAICPFLPLLPGCVCGDPSWDNVGMSIGACFPLGGQAELRL